MLIMCFFVALLSGGARFAASPGASTLGLDILFLLSMALALVLGIGILVRRFRRQARRHIPGYRDQGGAA